MASPTARRIKLFFRSLLGALLVAAGILHFVNPEPFLMIVPGYLPWPEALVMLSGVAEIVLGVAVFVPKLRPLAGWGVVALLIAVWPANIWMASEGIQPPGMEMSTPVAWIRVAMQVVLMVWAWAVTRPDADATEAARN